MASLRYGMSLRMAIAALALLPLCALADGTPFFSTAQVAQGRYEYSTIKPAPYPGDGPPAHIHYHVNAPGHQERVFEIVFEGDPKVNADIRARAAQENSMFSIRKLTRDAQGVWHCTQDVTLRK